MKRLLMNKDDFNIWKKDYDERDYAYSISWDESEPITYPCIIVFHTEEDQNSYKDHILYEFVYLTDFKI